MIQEDLKVEIKMNYKQILALITLMMENNNLEMENLLTLRDLTDYGIIQANKLE